MATVTLEVSTADSGNTPNVSGAFTPAAGDLLIVCVVASATVTEADGSLTSSAGTTFTLVRAASMTGSVDRLLVYVANSLSAASSQTVTYTPADAANGTVICVLSVTGVTRTGISAIRQSAEQENQTAGGTPAPAFGVAALTSNPCVGCIGNASSPAGLTPPSGWNETAGTDTGYTTPTTGLEVCSINSGFTGTTVTWLSTSATAFASIIVEIDTSAVPAQGVGWYGPAGWV